MISYTTQVFRQSDSLSCILPVLNRLQLSEQNHSQLTNYYRMPTQLNLLAEKSLTLSILSGSKSKTWKFFESSIVQFSDAQDLILFEKEKFRNIKSTNKRTIEEPEYVKITQYNLILIPFQSFKWNWLKCCSTDRIITWQL